jgi:hypothetical protein
MGSFDVGARGNDLGAEGLEHAALLSRHRIRDDDDAAVATNGAHESEPDPRIAGAGFDDRGARREQPAPLGVGDHGEGGAVFHATPGGEVLELGNHLRAPRGNDPTEAHERSLANGSENVAVDHRACMSVSQRRPPGQQGHGPACRHPVSVARVSPATTPRRAALDQGRADRRTAYPPAMTPPRSLMACGMQPPL